MPALAGCATAAPDPDPAEEIRALAAARGGAARLAVLARSGDPDLRRMACDALGDLGGPVDALAERLGDDAASVRHAAAFALARIAGAEAAAALRGQLDAADRNLRLIAARGLGRPGADGDVEGLLILAEGDAEPAVRGAAAISIGRILDGEAGPAELRMATEAALAKRLCAETDPDVRWRLAWALSRFGGAGAAPEVVATLRGAAFDPPAHEDLHGAARWSRVMAVRALGRRASDHAGLRAALIELVDPGVDAQLQLAALRALDAALPTDQPAPRELLYAVFWHADAGQAAVLARAIEVVDARATDEVLVTLLTEEGWVDSRPPRPDPVLPALLDHPDPGVRAAALLAAARHAPEQAIARATRLIHADDVRDRVAAARAAARLTDAEAQPLLEAAMTDADARVRTAGLLALPPHAAAPWADTLLARAAGERDLAIREELGTVLAGLAIPRPEIARAAFDDSPGEAFAEARRSLLAAVVAGGGADLDAWLALRLEDPSPAVRRAVARALGARGIAVAPVDPHEDPPLPRVGAEVPLGFLATRPVVEVHTTRGVFEVTLVPAAAPVHAWNFVQLAAGGRYDGTVFHRVVPDFVIQGGSRRGDGYDNLSWLDGRLRDEASPLPFDAGTLGMPKTVEPDSGGGQFFVTLLPAPHLDGRYTAFGRVTAGLAVVESIEVGDRILRTVAKSR
jgi:peptidylprolyl isomerase